MTEPVANKPLLERLGVQYFQRRSQRVTHSVSTDAVHLVNEEERARMRDVERGAILRSCIAGALSATASAIAELVAGPQVPNEAPVFSWASLQFWLIVGGVTLIASVVEIAFLYWDTLRSVHELARVAGLELFGPNRQASDAALTEALARAALELPNPVIGPRGINSRRESSRWRLALASVAYKAKVGVTTFVIKLLVRRVLGRVVARSVVSTVLPFVAVPITAAWNGVVTWWLLREARLRAMGPSVVTEFAKKVFERAPQLSADGRLSAVRAIASAIVRTQECHPNLTALFEVVAEHAGETRGADLDDVGQFLSSLRRLPPAEVHVALQFLAVACIVDGKFSSRERRLWRDALATTGKSLALEPVEKLRRSFVDGHGINEVDLQSLIASVR